MIAVDFSPGPNSPRISFPVRFSVGSNTFVYYPIFHPQGCYCKILIWKSVHVTLDTDKSDDRNYKLMATVGAIRIWNTSKQRECGNLLKTHMLDLHPGYYPHIQLLEDSVKSISWCIDCSCINSTLCHPFSMSLSSGLFPGPSSSWRTLSETPPPVLMMDPSLYHESCHEFGTAPLSHGLLRLWSRGVLTGHPTSSRSGYLYTRTFLALHTASYRTDGSSTEI